MKNGEQSFLIVEDQASVRLVLGSALKKFGKRIVSFEDGFSAMHWLMDANFPSIIFLDLDVPRLSGKDFLKQIKRSGFFQGIPVVIITGDDSEKAKEYCNQFGVEEYITKPFDPVELKDKVAKILKEQEASGKEMYASSTGNPRLVFNFSK